MANGNVKFSKPTVIRGNVRDGRITSNDIDNVRDQGVNQITQVLHEFQGKVKRWRGPLRDLGAAYHAAFNNVKTILGRDEAEKKRNLDLMFSALGLVCGGGISWIGFALKGSATYSASKCSEAIKDLIVGHITDTIKYGTDQGLKAVQSSLEPKVPSLLNTPKDFETQIIKSFEAQIKVIEDFLVTEKGKVLCDDEWAQWVYFEKGNGNKSQAYNWINKELTKYLKQAWCNKVYYYRTPPNLPPRITMERIIERAMWVKILTQRIALRKFVSHSGYGVSFYTGDAIETRLVELNLMKPDSTSDRRKIAAEKAKVQRAGGKWSSRPSALSNPGEWTSHDDMVKMAMQLKRYRPEKIGNLIPTKE